VSKEVEDGCRPLPCEWITPEDTKFGKMIKIKPFTAFYLNDPHFIYGKHDISKNFTKYWSNKPTRK
jgi:hypothetical protein